MRVAQLYTQYRVGLRDKEVAILREIGFSGIPTATSFVSYLCERYGLSKSGVWYCLKKLKEEGVLEFTEKGEDYTPLRLTSKGIALFRHSMAQNGAQRMQELSVAALQQSS